MLKTLHSATISEVVIHQVSRRLCVLGVRLLIYYLRSKDKRVDRPFLGTHLWVPFIGTIFVDNSESRARQVSTSCEMVRKTAFHPHRLIIQSLPGSTNKNLSSAALGVVKKETKDAMLLQEICVCTVWERCEFGTLALR